MQSSTAKGVSAQLWMQMSTSPQKNEMADVFVSENNIFGLQKHVFLNVLKILQKQ